MSVAVITDNPVAAMVHERCETHVSRSSHSVKSQRSGPAKSACRVQKLQRGEESPQLGPVYTIQLRACRASATAFWWLKTALRRPSSRAVAACMCSDTGATRPGSSLGLGFCIQSHRLICTSAWCPFVCSEQALSGQRRLALHTQQQAGYVNHGLYISSNFCTCQQS